MPDHEHELSAGGAATFSRWRNSANRGVALCGVAALLFGASTPLASRLVGELGAFTLAGALYVGAAAAVLPFAGRNRPDRQAWRTGWARLAAAVVAGGAVGPALLAMGLALVPAATASLLLNFELVFTTILAGVFFREYIGGGVAAGTACVVGAGLLLAWSDVPQLRWGALLIVLACVAWALDNSVTADLDSFTPSQITFVKGVIAGGANLALGVALEGVPPVNPLLLAMLVGAFGYGASIALWIAGARELGAARGQLIFAAAPFLGALLAWTVLGERAEPRELAALALVLVGVGFVLRSGHSHLHRHTAQQHRHQHSHDDGHHSHHHDPPVDGVHEHLHTHSPVSHAHPHVPDLHHKHGHEQR